MATQSTKEEWHKILAEFLHEKTLVKLKKKSTENCNSKQLLRDFYEVICDDSKEENEVFIAEGVASSRLTELALRFPALFSSQILLQTSAEYLRDLEDSENYARCWKICAILSEIIKNCSLEWFLGIAMDDLKFLAPSDLERPKRNIADFTISLLKLANLMPFSNEQLTNHAKLHLFPRVLELCNLIVQKVSENSRTADDGPHPSLKLSIVKKISCEIVMTCLQQIGNQKWIMNESQTISSDVLDFLVAQCGCQSVVELVSGLGSRTSKDSCEDGCAFPGGLLGSILANIKTLMAKKKLPDCPVAKHVLVRSITNVKHPCLGEHISMILPPLLLLVDDYRVANRVAGIETLTHVIENVNATELCWYGRADTIYDALHHRMHSNEPQVIQVLHPCILKVIKVIEHSPVKVDCTFNKCDENFQIILAAMEYESKIVMRRAYCSHLAIFIDYMGVTVVRHFKRLLRVIFGYLEIGDEETEEWRIAMLDVLERVIFNAWPRISSHSDEILMCLMRLIIDISLSSDAPRKVKDLMFGKIEKCLLLLMCICGEAVVEQLECMTTSLGSREAEELIARSLDAYKLQQQTSLS